MPQAPITRITLSDRPVDVLRLELAFPDVQGNKHFKLKYNLEKAQAEGYKSVLTFGGVFSNHVHAVAVACSKRDMKAIFILRGEDDPNNPTLQFVRSLGMETLFISREMYRLRNMPAFVEELSAQHGKVLVLPEGGTNALAIQGCAEILQGIESDYDHIFCAVGTGGTLAGLISTPGLTASVTGVAVIKGDKDTLTPTVKNLLSTEAANVQWRIVFDARFGGYGKYHPELHTYLEQFEKQHGIRPDPMYTGKMFVVAEEMLRKGLVSGSRILCVHTGGLQGWDGWYYRYANKYTDQPGSPTTTEQ